MDFLEILLKLVFAIDKSTLHWTILLAVCISVLIYYLKIILAGFLFRKKYSKLLPRKQFYSFSLLGNVTTFPLSRSARNGYHATATYLQVLGGLAELFRQQKLFCFWVSYTPVVMLVKAQAAQELFYEENALKKPFIYKWMHPFLGGGLLSSDIRTWKPHRKLLNTCFHSSNLKDFMHEFNYHSRKLVKTLQSETDKDFTKISEPVTLCSLDIINGVILGISLDDHHISGAANVKALREGERIMVSRVGAWWTWPDSLYYISKFFPAYKEKEKYVKHLEWMQSFTKSVFLKKKRDYLSGTKKTSDRNALIDLLLQIHLQKEDFSEKDAVDELNTLLVTGHETTAVSICWALYLIGLHKDVQKKIHEELDFIFGDDKERPVTMDDIRDLKYLNCALQESRRLYPSVPFYGRELEKDANICGYEIPKGTICLIAPYVVHRDPDVFPDPEKFDPDRFLPENSAKIPPCAYIPFASGGRNCIGKNFAMLEEKVVVSSILRNFTIESLDPRDKLVPFVEVTLHSFIPIRLKIRTRIK